MVWNLEDVAMKPFTNVYNEILMVLEASGSCCESISDGLESVGNCYEAIYTLLQWNIHGFGSFMRLWINYLWFWISKKLVWSHLRTFTMKYLWFCKLQEVAVNPLFLVWNLKPTTSPKPKPAASIEQSSNGAIESDFQIEPSKLQRFLRGPLEGCHRLPQGGKLSSQPTCKYHHCFIKI